MKTYSIKNYSGTKMLIVNNLELVNVQELYKLSVEKGIFFAVKQEIGVQIWGLALVAKYLGINDTSKVLN